MTGSLTQKALALLGAASVAVLMVPAVKAQSFTLNNAVRWL